MMGEEVMSFDCLDRTPLEQPALFELRIGAPKVQD